MERRIYGYARVSTKLQSEERQLAELEKYVPKDRIYVDKASGKDFNREKYQLLKNEILREGDILYVKSLDRFGRNKTQIRAELNELKEKNIEVKILNIPTMNGDEYKKVVGANQDIINLINDIIVDVLAYVAEKERDYIKERQAEGFKQVKIKGTKTGNPVGRPIVEKPILWNEYYQKYKNKEITANYAMKVLNLKRNTFYKLVKEEENDK